MMSAESITKSGDFAGRQRAFGLFFESRVGAVWSSCAVLLRGQALIREPAAGGIAVVILAGDGGVESPDRIRILDGKIRTARQAARPGAETSARRMRL